MNDRNRNDRNESQVPDCRTPGHGTGTSSGGRRRDEPVAVALNYDREKRDSAPVVTASGRGLLAEQILELAAREGIPIQEDSDLVELLAATEIGDEIPVDAFVAVAEILRYVYALNRSFPNPPPEREDMIATAGRHRENEQMHARQTEYTKDREPVDGEPDDPYSAV